MIELVAQAVHFTVRAHVWAWRHAFGDRPATKERDAPLPLDLTQDD